MTVGASLSSLPICTVIPRPLSENAREAGTLPDMRDWESADIILFGATAPSRISRMISLVQQRYGASAHWTHAALYTGRGRLIEAVIHPKRVIARGIDAYVPGRTIAHLRYPGLSSAERSAIVAAAALTMDARYSIRRALRVGADEWFRSRLPRTYSYYGKVGHQRTHAKAAAVVSRCICSDVIEHAFIVGANVTLVSEDIKFVMPASLHASDLLDHTLVSRCRL